MTFNQLIIMINSWLKLIYCFQTVKTTFKYLLSVQYVNIKKLFNQNVQFVVAVQKRDLKRDKRNDD